MRKMNVLLVDDNPLFLTMARAVIAALPGVDRIECVNSGAEALLRAGKSRPDLVLTDITMPNMSGFELIRGLRARDNPPSVVGLTQHDSPQYRAAALRLGAQDLIAKHELRAAIPELISSLAGEAG